ncbi:hypothetical protein QFZ56_005931 [Streptomyces achromogenes]|uniref:SAVED domain-containing protein n=1 Tax=Streptomyces achromogenes TaxID=67255 RepID=A0ABU0QB06_STRAH|nr:hypothetical protein [Streptomyces achromogenes]
MGSGGLELPPGDEGHEGGSADVPPGTVSLARPMETNAIGPELDWDTDAWREVRTRAQRAGRAYVWLNLVEQRLRAVVAAVLRPIYEPVHGDEWVVAAAGPAGQEWVQRAVAVREVSRRKGYLLDPADDNVISFLTLPQLRELMVQHWPCFEPYLDDRRDVELALDELEVTRNVVSRNRALSEAVLNQAERASARLLEMLGTSGDVPSARRLPVDAVEDLVGDRYADVVAVHSDRVRLLRQFPAEDIFDGSRRIDAIGIGLNLLVQNFSGRRLVRLAEGGTRVRLLFLNPASSAVKRRERELGMKRGELSRAVEMNILHMRRVRSRLRDPGAFQIQVYDETAPLHRLPRRRRRHRRHRGDPVLSAAHARHGGSGAGAAGRQPGGQAGRGGRIRPLPGIPRGVRAGLGGLAAGVLKRPVHSAGKRKALL